MGACVDILVTLFKHIQTLSYDNVKDVTPGDLVQVDEEVKLWWPPDGMRAPNDRLTGTKLPPGSLVLVIGVDPLYVKYSGYRRVDLIVLVDSHYWWVRCGNQ